MKELFVVRLPEFEYSLRTEGFTVSYFETYERSCLALHQRNVKNQQLPVAIISLVDENEAYIHLINFVKKMRSKIHVIPYTYQFNKAVKAKAFEMGAADYLFGDIETSDITERITDLAHWMNYSQLEKRYQETKIPTWKRTFDIIVSGMSLLMLSPLFLIVALAIKFSSKGPVFYSSPRVGTGYKIFPFYKFRSMRVDADKMLGDMKHLNHYAQALKQEVIDPAIEKGPILVGDDTMIPEALHEHNKKQEEKETFIKFQNDPRITKIGHFIRKTSIDELPQLLNVLLGHMSIVGNRPLPLYEAEKLTTDQWTRRFMAPAGITGLWQVTERGKASTSEDSRKQLDIIYAKKFSFMMDLKILLKTPLAAIQQEKV